MKPQYYPALTGIRAVAAFMVIVHHSFFNYFENEYVTRVLRELNIGVNIFFVLSGFLIWHHYSYNYTLSGSWLKTFFIHRFARIYPLYLLLSSWTIVIMHFAYDSTLSESFILYFLNITFLSGYSSEFVYTSIPQAWTLSIEILFYFSAPILLYYYLKKKVSLLFQGICIIFIGALFYLIFNKIDYHGFFNNITYIRITTFFGRFTEFFAGIFLAIILKSNLVKKRQVKYFTLVGGILLIISIVIIQPNFQSISHEYSIQSWAGYFYNVLVLPVIVCILFYGLINESSILNRILSTKPLLFLGKSSYALYLVHYGMTSYLIHTFVSDNIFLEILIIYIISIVLWKFFEEPCYRYIRKFGN